MAKKSTSDNVLTQILSCLDAATARPGLVKASVYQTEGYLRGLQGMAWEKPAATEPSNDDASRFLRDVRQGAIPLRGRIKDEARASLELFLEGLSEGFPKSGEKRFASALGRLWVRWSGHDVTHSRAVGGAVGRMLKEEYDEGVAGELSAYILDDRLHLRNARDYLRMRGWLQGTIENLRRKGDWRNRELSSMLEANLSSIILRALHNADLSYAATAAEKLPEMIAALDAAIENLASIEPEASHFLRKNRSTVLTHALHSGYLDYPARAARELPNTLKGLNVKIADLEKTTPDAARDLRASVSSLIYRALTNGRLDAV